MLELQLIAPQDCVEALSDALMELHGALSVSVEDADADTLHEQALFGEPDMPAPAAGWSRSVLRALFEHDVAATEAAAAVLADPAFSGTVQLRALQTVEEQDWVRLTQSQFAPVDVSPGFWIVPSWHEPPAGARQLIRLDPGMAFGTGTHPTTRMCLQWIDERLRVGETPPLPRVLDYGCGSGILAIATAQRGAREVLAVDIDPAAVVATRQNAEANHVALTAGLPELATGRFALVLANILATPLKLMAPLLTALMDDGGDLVLAGILARQADELSAAYAPWVDLRVDRSLDGWVLMTAHRPRTHGSGMMPA
jgi:ribosomal protein L11 methyltransferase